MAAERLTAAGLLADLALPPIAPRARAGPQLALARACGIRSRTAASARLRVHDALAGWGTDGLVLAALGCAVHMSECKAAVYQRLCQRLAAEAAPADEVTVALEDARERWQLSTKFDVIYLDPLFGPHPKTALPARHMQVLADIAEPVEDLGAFIDQACAATRGRVVVKRRRSASTVGVPAWHIDAKTVRFDIYRATR